MRTQLRMRMGTGSGYVGEDVASDAADVAAGDGDGAKASSVLTLDLRACKQ